MRPHRRLTRAITTTSRWRTAASIASIATSTRGNGSSTDFTISDVSGRSEYVELRARSAFSFLEGASAPEELAESAAVLGYDAIALGDRDGLYGAPRFYQAATGAGVKAIVGAELVLGDLSFGQADASATPARLY